MCCGVYKISKVSLLPALELRIYWRCVAAYYIVLQCVECVDIFNNQLASTIRVASSLEVCCSVLQCVAVCCSAMQCDAVCKNVNIQLATRFRVARL